MRIMIAVQNKVLESALISLIDLFASGDEILSCSDQNSFFKNIKKANINLVLLDWDFFDSKTREVIRLSKQYNPLTRLICMDTHHDNVKKDNAGADAFYYKSNPPVELLNLINGFR